MALTPDQSVVIAEAVIANLPAVVGTVLVGFSSVIGAAIWVASRWTKRERDNWAAQEQLLRQQIATQADLHKAELSANTSTAALVEERLEKLEQAIAARDNDFFVIDRSDNTFSDDDDFGSDHILGSTEPVSNNNRKTEADTEPASEAEPREQLFHLVGEQWVPSSNADLLAMLETIRDANNLRKTDYKEAFKLPLPDPKIMLKRRGKGTD